MRWLIWGLLLAFTNGASTLVSRARNTPSYWYHGLTSLLNHATWFFANVLLVGVAVDIGSFKDVHKVLLAWSFYAVCSTIGSVVSHFVSIKFLERGNRRVGAYT